MERATIQYIAAVIAGLAVMILFAAVTVNLMQSIPIAGPFVGGLVAGAVAGLLGAVVVAADLMADTSLLRIAVPPFPKLAGFLFLVVAVFYFPILAFIGGVFGGMVRRWPASLRIDEDAAPVHPPLPAARMGPSA